MEETHLDAIVFPRFTEGSALNASPLSRAETGLGLMAGLINARNLPGHGFAEATRIARAIPAWRLEYGGFAQLADWAGPFLL